MVDWANLRGVGYIPATTQMRDPVQAMLRPVDARGQVRQPRSAYSYPPYSFIANNPRGIPFGQFVDGIVCEELRFLRSRGFNNIRTYGTFLAWLIDSAEYRRNLTFIKDTCRDLGMSITFKLWSGGGRYFGTPYLLTEALARLGIAPLPAVIQLGADSAHLEAQIRFGWSGYVPRLPRRSYFQMGGWTEPDGYLRFDRVRFVGPRAPQRWDGMFPEIEAAGGGRRLSVLMRDYLRDVASVFGDSETLLSYDLYNEPDIGYHPKLHVLTPFVQFVEFTRSELAAAHPNRRLEFTVGLGSPENLLPFYLPLSGLLTYASFHEFTRGMWDPGQSPGRFRRIRGFAQRLGLPLVCSEFFSPEEPRTHNRGKLGVIAGNLVRYGIGGQIWAVLETNAFAQVGPNAVPTDGLYESTDPGTLSAPVWTQPVLRAGITYRQDELALANWTGGFVPPSIC